MCYGVARPEPTGREFAGFESVDGGVRGILGFRHQVSAVSYRRRSDVVAVAKFFAHDAPDDRLPVRVASATGKLTADDRLI
jgi:hypothetical protein